MIPKQIAILDGKVVARTYECKNILWNSRYVLKFEPNPDTFGEFDDISFQFYYIYRDNYFNLRKMVDKIYPGAIWEDANV